MTAPFAVYFASRARAGLTRFLWGAAAVLLLVGAATTVSRTVVSMVVVMILVALIVRKRAVLRYWPVLIVLLAAVHFAAPRTLGSLYHSFFPQGGLYHSQSARSGAIGSGRIADIGRDCAAGSRTRSSATGSAPGRSAAPPSRARSSTRRPER